MTTKKQLQDKIKELQEQVDAMPDETPKGFGVVDWDKPVYALLWANGVVVETSSPLDQLEGELAQGYVSNDKAHLEQRSRENAVYTKLTQCDGAVRKPVEDEDGCYHGVSKGGSYSRPGSLKVANQYALCHFISMETAKAAAEKHGDEIREVFGTVVCDD